MKKKYRKKSTIIIEAAQAEKAGVIKTLEGVMSYKAGDYIITGIRGEKYPCRRDIFEETYEEVFLDDADNKSDVISAEDWEGIDLSDMSEEEF